MEECIGKHGVERRGCVYNLCISTKGYVKTKENMLLDYFSSLLSLSGMVFNIGLFSNIGL